MARRRHARAPRRRSDRRLIAGPRRARHREVRGGSRPASPPTPPAAGCVPPRIGVGREGREHDQPRGARAAARTPRLARRHHRIHRRHRRRRRPALRFGVDFGFETVEDVQDEITTSHPRTRASTPRSSAAPVERAVLPITEFPDEIVLHASQGFTAGVSWEPIPPAPSRRNRRRHDPGSRSLTRLVLPSTGSPRRRRRACASTVQPVPPRGRPRAATRTHGRIGHLTDALAPGAALVVHPSDLSRIGVAAVGDEVHVTRPAAR